LHTLDRRAIESDPVGTADRLAFQEQFEQAVGNLGQVEFTGKRGENFLRLASGGLALAHGFDQALGDDLRSSLREGIKQSWMRPTVP